MTDQPTPPLHEQVRTLEADLVMCREQLAQETERAEKAEKMATSPGSPLVQQSDTYRRILGHPAIYTHTGVNRMMSMSDQIIARLDELAEAEAERDEWRDRAESYRLDVAAIRDALDAPDDADINQLIDIVHALTEQVEKADRLPEPDHTNRSWPGTRWACADTEPDSLVRCQRPKGHPGDHRYEDRYGKGIRWGQADANEELIEKAARTLAFAVERNDDDVSESEMWGVCLTPESRFRYRNQARALLAANILRDGGEG